VGGRTDERVPGGVGCHVRVAVVWPLADAGEWQTLHAVFLAPRFDDKGKKIANAKLSKGLLNGQLIHENQELLTPTGDRWRGPELAEGPLMIQADHGPIAYRNLLIRTPMARKQTKEFQAQERVFHGTQKDQATIAWPAALAMTNSPSTQPTTPGTSPRASWLFTARAPFHLASGWDTSRA